MLLAVISVQSWRVVDAIVQVERAAVVPLPTRAPRSAAVPTVEPTGQPNVVVTVPATEREPTSTPDSVGAAATDADPTPTAAPISTAPAPEPTATSRPSIAQAGGDDETSHFDVFRQLISSGINEGDPGTAEAWGGRTDLYILILGVDRRAEGGDQNADVIILAHLDLIEKRIAAVSVPRDLLVEIPGVGPDKINGSYNYGVEADADNVVAGVAMVRDTVEDAFGIPIDGYVLVDFDGFEEAVDAVGGIEVNVPYEMYDPAYPTADFGTEEVYFEPGVQHMDGETALKYVRTRHADNDDQRRERQMQVLLALFEKGQQISSITKADELILAASGSIQTSFALDQQLLLARIAWEMEPTQIRWSSLGPPILQPGETPAGAWVYTGDPATIVGFVEDALVTAADRFP
ncbi:MAG: LCP family protein [Thermomicrobiales bacterium]